VHRYVSGNGLPAETGTNMGIRPFHDLRTRLNLLSSIRYLFGERERESRSRGDSMLLNGRQAFSLMAGGEPTASGESINETTSLQISWVYSCVRVIAETAGCIPLRIYEQTSEGEKEARDHSLSYLLDTQPNSEMSAPVSIETLTGAIALTGNGYIEIVRDGRKNPIALYPRNPLKVTPQRNDAGFLEYAVEDSEVKRIVPAKDMIHVPLWSFNGLRGHSPVQLQAQTLGFAQATLKQGARFIGNGFSPKGLITPDGPLTAEQGQQLREMLEKQGSGNNQGRLAVLPAPMKYMQMGLSMSDAAFLESRGFSRNEIAAIFRLDPHFIGDTTRQSTANSEQASLNLILETMSPYLTKIATEFNRKLLPMTARKRSSYLIRFDLTERLRADMKTTLETLALGRQWSLLTIDEGRKQLGLNPVGGELGNSLMSPVNMMSADKWVTDWNPSHKKDTPKE
jgi:HK97 family phage portal protein